MTVWEDFELKCTDYLNQQFGKYASFMHQGGTDSTVPDILVKTLSGKIFYIDAKHSPAQCGQFVLLPNIQTNSFTYSMQNTTPLNDWSKMIILHMNQAFDEYREAGTTGKDIIFADAQKIFANWIIESYKRKNVMYFITNDFTILPIEQFADYFEISAKYRIKRSGSSSVGKNRIAAYTQLLSDNKKQLFEITSTRTDGNKLYVSSDKELHNLRFKDDTYEYMFSIRNNEYEVRKLSNTYNANVIFSIKFKNKSGISNNEFINCLS